jgi:hypothetical protein
MSLRKEIWQFDKRELDERTKHVTINFYNFAHWMRPPLRVQIKKFHPISHHIKTIK